MKKIFALLIIITTLFSACQKTPENLIVQNKADDELQEAIAQTATPNPRTSSEGNNPTQSPQSSEPVAYIEDISSNSSNTVTVEINAEVINNQPEKIPVVEIEPKLFTEDEVKQMVQAFFGNTQLYSRKATKEDYDQRILNLKYRISNDEELLKSDYATTEGITDIAKIKAEYQKQLERMIEKRENAPEVREKADFSEVDSFNGISSLIDTGKGFFGSVRADKNIVLLTAFNDNSMYYISRDFFGSGTRPVEIGLDDADTEFQDAKQSAVELINELGIESTLGAAYLANDSYLKSSARQYYVFFFNMKINDTSLGHTLLSGNVSYAIEEVFENLREYERLEVWIENDQLVQFRYRMPMKIAEVLNDNVAVNIDYSQAIELAKQHAYVKFIDTYGNFTEAKLGINKIELNMVRTRERENGDYIVVPAWNFRGTLSEKYKPELIEVQGADEQGWYITKSTDDILITVNALDGTIIDMAHGY